MKTLVKQLLIIDKTIVREMETNYQELLAENNLSDKMLANHLIKYILPTIAVYKVLINNGMSDETAYKWIKESVFASTKSA